MGDNVNVENEELLRKMKKKKRQRRIS